MKNKLNAIRFIFLLISLVGYSQNEQNFSVTTLKGTTLVANGTLEVKDPLFNQLVLTNNKFLSVICGNTNKPTAAMTRQII